MKSRFFRVRRSLGDRVRQSEAVRYANSCHRDQFSKVYAKFMQGRNIRSPKYIKGRQHTLYFLGLLGGGGRGRRAQLTLFPRNACASTSALCQA
jgi:hypothetical protein